MSVYISQIRVSYHLAYAQRQTSDTKLKRTVALDLLNHVSGDLSVDI